MNGGFFSTHRGEACDVVRHDCEGGVVLGEGEGGLVGSCVVNYGVCYYLSAAGESFGVFGWVSYEMKRGGRYRYVYLCSSIIILVLPFLTCYCSNI